MAIMPLSTQEAHITKRKLELDFDPQNTHFNPQYPKPQKPQIEPQNRNPKSICQTLILP